MTLSVFFCASWCFALVAVFVGWTSMVGILWGSVVWSLISLTEHSRFALASVCVGSLVVLGLYLLVVPLLVVFLLQQVYWCSQLPPNLVCDQWQGVGKMDKTGGEYSIGFKVPTSREKIGDPLDKHSINRDILPYSPFFIKGESKIGLFWEGRIIWAECRKQSTCARLDDEI